MTRRLLVIPPHADHTLAAVAPEGFELLDLPRAFAERVLRAPFLEQAAAKGSLPLQAALRWLGSPAGDPLQALRVAGAVFAELSAPPSPIGLTLDDVELRPGTTERSADAAAVAARPGAPYEPELEAAVEAARGAEVVRVELDRDQQLPAAIALLGRLERVARVELVGRFAEEHQERLRALEPFRRRDFPGGRVERRVGALRWRSPGDPIPDAPWAGYVSVEELEEALPGCERAIVPFVAASDGGQVTGISGVTVEVRRRPGLALVGEWWIGAPSVGREELERSVEPASQLFDWVAALRRFSFPRDTAPGMWRGVPVRVRAPEPDRDLRRTDAFEAALDGPAIDDDVQHLFAALEARRPLAPGRVALAYLQLPSWPRDEGRVGLDPDAALIPGDGAGATVFNLRTGTAIPLQPPLDALVGALATPVAEADALPMLPEPQRGLVLRTLISKGLVIRC